MLRHSSSLHPFQPSQRQATKRADRLTYGVPQGIPLEATAAQFMVETVARYPGRVTILALAALTNVALALQIDPSMAERLVRPKKRALPWYLHGCPVGALH